MLAVFVYSVCSVTVDLSHLFIVRLFSSVQVKIIFHLDKIYLLSSYLTRDSFIPALVPPIGRRRGLPNVKR
jgi:hypothetical protein